MDQLHLLFPTMGTVLALISVILQDPDAFVARSPLSFKRTFTKILLIIGWRLNKTFISSIETNLLLSFNIKLLVYHLLKSLEVS